MPEPTQSQQPIQEPAPRVLYGDGVDPMLTLGPEETAQTMHELNISERGIGNATIYADPKNRLLNRGTHYPKWAVPMRFPFNRELREPKGDVIRLSTVMRGEPIAPEVMNRTLTHELEHVAQEDRHDRKIIEGRVAIWGLTAAGAILGQRLGRGPATKTVGALIGAGIGNRLGYHIAPHERQARVRAGNRRHAGQVTSHAVSIRKNTDN